MAIKNTDDLRELLSGVIENVTKGDMPSPQANAVSNLVGKFMQTVQLDMKYCEMREKMPKMRVLEAISVEEKPKLEKIDKETGEILN